MAARRSVKKKEKVKVKVVEVTDWSITLFAMSMGFMIGLLIGMLFTESVDSYDGPRISNAVADGICADKYGENFIYYDESEWQTFSCLEDKKGVLTIVNERS